MSQRNSQNLSVYVDRLNDLYVMTRHKYILQRKDGHVYTTLSYAQHKTKLTDKLLLAHIKQELTVGVFAGKYLNKFICFDVDCKNQSKVMAQELIECLVEQFGFEKSQILVSYSGSKGYHVELFFDKALQIKYLQFFYKIVLQSLGARREQIEFRNTYSQAVKLPLAINWKTGHRCHLVDTETLEPVDDSQLLQVEKVDTELFLEQLYEYWQGSNIRLVNPKNSLTLEAKIAQEFEELVAQVKLDIPVDYEQRCLDMLEQNSLLYPNSRHNSTLLLAIFLKEQGWEPEDVIEKILGILHNTFLQKREFFSQDTTLELIDSETNRIVSLVYERDYKLGNKARKPIRVTKDDILFVLKPKKIHLRQLLFTMLCHSKRYARKDGAFYMTYKQMSEYGNTDNLGRLVNYIQQLKSAGLLEVIRRNERQEKSHLSKPNVYRLTHQIASQNVAEYIELESISADDFVRVTAQLIPEKELKQLVTKKQFYSTFKQYYTR